MTWPGPLVDRGDGSHEIPADYKGRDGNLRMRVPGRVFADEALLPHIMEDQALEQVANVASLPGIVGASLAMPDIHWGYGFPIGGVAAFDPEDGVVSPGGVGFDINCGVRLLATDIEAADVSDMEGLMDALFARVPAGMGSRGDGVSGDDLDDIMDQGADWAVRQGILASRDRDRLEERGRIDFADPAMVDDRARLRGQRTLGSLGSGNHFLELQEVAEVLEPDAAAAFGVAPGRLVVMIHSGSRGLGHQVCQDHVQALQGKMDGLIDRQLAASPLGSDEAAAYLGAMAAAANFAFVNRSVLAHRTAEVLADHGATCQTVYDVCHNIAKWEDHQVDGATRRVCVHRKGATRALGPGDDRLPAAYQRAGQPVIVPGDMGRASWLLAGQGNPESFTSSCHGAGRRMSRSQAKRTFEGQALIDQLRSQGIIVKATSNNVAAEEAPEAYKDVSQVVASVERAGLAKRVARMRPLGVVKG